MYAQFGNIKFEALKGFDDFQNNRSTNYAEHAVIDGRPKLQRVGTNLQEVSITISFHKTFCDPEVEFLALDNYRESGEAQSLVYGNGLVLGKFVITSVSKRINQTTANGDYVHITVDLNLKEFYDGNTEQTLNEQDLREAFATNPNRPLPTNSVVPPHSPAAQTMAQLKDAQKGADQSSKISDGFAKETNRINALIAKAQKFRDMSQIFQAKLTAAINKVDTKLQAMNDILNVYTSIRDVAPGIQDAIDAARASTGAARNVVNKYATLPGVINTTVEATYALDVMGGTITETAAMQKALSDLKAVAAPIANYVAARK